MSTTTFQDYCTAAQGTFLYSTEEWIQYLKDHRATLIDTAEEITITPEEEQMYRFRPRLFLAAKQLDPTLWWIFLFINRIDTVMEFCNFTKLKLPNTNLLQILLSRFRTDQSLKSKS